MKTSFDVLHIIKDLALIYNNNNLIFTANVFAGTYQDPNPLDFPMPLAQPQDYYWNTNFQNTTGRGDDGVIFAVDQDKKLIWSTFWGGQFEDIIRGATVDYNGNRLFIAGETANLNYLYPNAQYPYELNELDDNSPLDYFNSNGYSQAFGALFSLQGINTPLTNVSINEINDLNNVSIYPKPSSDVINITSKEKIKSIEMYDTKGSQVFIDYPDNKQTQLNIASLANGIYSIRCRTDLKIVTLKIIKL